MHNIGTDSDGNVNLGALGRGHTPNERRVSFIGRQCRTCDKRVYLDFETPTKLSVAENSSCPDCGNSLRVNSSLVKGWIHRPMINDIMHSTGY